MIERKSDSNKMHLKIIFIFILLMKLITKIFNLNKMHIKTHNPFLVNIC